MRMSTVLRNAIFAIFACLTANAVFAQTTAFNYQGKLSDSGAAQSSYQMRFELFDAAAGGNQIGGTIADVSVTVNQGVFNLPLDFGANVFTGGDRFLEIAVRRNATEAYRVLSPRQQIASSPYSIRTLSAAQADVALDSNKLGGIDAGEYLTTTTVGNSVITNSTTQQAGNFNIDGNGTLGGTLTAASLNGNGSGLTNVPGTFLWQVVAGTSRQAQPNTGYVAANAGQVTITLPTAPNIGDTIRISGTGAGGWKIAQNAGQSVNIPGTFGATWTPRESNRSWYSIDSSSDGTKLVAVVNGGQIHTSTDSGATWTPRETNRSWFSVASSSDGSKLVAVVFFGQIYTSTDSGVTWTPHESNRQWYSVASSSDGTKLVAVVNGGQIYTSTNSGVTWTPHETNRAWYAVASSADGTKLVAVVNNGQIYTSADSGAGWAPRESNRNWVFKVDSSADGSKLVAMVTNGQIYTSADSGATWTPRESARSWVDIASSSDGSKLVAAVNGGQIYTSADAGATWTPRESNRNWESVTSSADGSKLVAAVYGGRIYTSISTSTPGTAGYLIGEPFAAVELQYIGNGQFILLSHEGTITAN